MQNERPTSTITRAAAPPRGAIFAIMAFACAALLSACGSSKSSTESAKAQVETGKVAKDIEHTIATKRGLKARVLCPAPMPAVPGNTFECVASVEAATAPHAVTKTPFIVTIQSPRGYVTYASK